MADTSDDIVYRVVEPFSFDIEGRPWAMRQGDLVGPGHPAYDKYKDSHLLEPTTAEAVRRSTPVTATETATAAPGAKRGRSAPVVQG